MPLFDLPYFKPDFNDFDVLTDPTLLPTHAQTEQRAREIKKKTQRMSTRSLDQFVFKVSALVAARIDCKQCANCCKQLEPDLTNEEIPVLARMKNCSVERFSSEFTRVDVETNERFISTKPCVFLQNNLCNVYAARPNACSAFPNLDEPGFKFRFARVMATYNVCPIVYNTVELLHQAVLQHEDATTSPT